MIAKTHTFASYMAHGSISEAATNSAAHYA